MSATSLPFECYAAFSGERFGTPIQAEWPVVLCKVSSDAVLISVIDNGKEAEQNGNWPWFMIIAIFIWYLHN